MAARFLTQSEMANCSTATCSDMRCLPKRKYSARKEVKEERKGDDARAKRRATSEIMRTAGQESKDMELLGKSREELRALSAEMGEPAYRGDQLYRALYAERIFDLALVTSLPVAFREKLAKETAVTLPTVRQRFQSADGSVR